MPSSLVAPRLQELMNGFAAQTQQALNDQYTALAQQVMMGQEQNAKAVRVAEARTRQVPQQQTPATGADGSDDGEIRGIAAANWRLITHLSWRMKTVLEQSM